MIALILASMLCYALYHYNLQLIEPISPLWQDILNMMQQQLGESKT